MEGSSDLKTNKRIGLKRAKKKISKEAISDQANGY